MIHSMFSVLFSGGLKHVGAVFNTHTCLNFASAFHLKAPERLNAKNAADLYGFWWLFKLRRFEKCIASLDGIIPVEVWVKVVAGLSIRLKKALQWR